MIKWVPPGKGRSLKKHPHISQLIQAGLTDERDDLLDEVAKMEKECAETEKTLDTLIADDSTLLGNADLSLSQDVGK